MAIFYPDELGTTGIPAVGDQVQASRFDAGNLRFVDATYTMVGTETASDYIRVCKLRKGEAVIPYLSAVVSLVDVAGASTTLDIGDDDGSGSDTRYASQLDVAAVGADTFDEIGSDLHVITEDCWLLASFAVVNTPAAGGKLNFRVVIRRP